MTASPASPTDALPIAFIEEDYLDDADWFEDVTGEGEDVSGGDPEDDLESSWQEGLEAALEEDAFDLGREELTEDAPAFAASVRPTQRPHRRAVYRGPRQDSRLDSRQDVRRLRGEGRKVATSRSSSIQTPSNWSADLQEKLSLAKALVSQAQRTSQPSEAAGLVGAAAALVLQTQPHVYGLLKPHAASLVRLSVRLALRWHAQAKTRRQLAQLVPGLARTLTDLAAYASRRSEVTPQVVARTFARNTSERPTLKRGAPARRRVA